MLQVKKISLLPHYNANICSEAHHNQINYSIWSICGVNIKLPPFILLFYVNYYDHKNISTSYRCQQDDTISHIPDGRTTKSLPVSLLWEI